MKTFAFLIYNFGNERNVNLKESKNLKLKCTVPQITWQGSKLGGWPLRHDPQTSLWYLALLMLSSRASSVGGSEQREGGVEVILTPPVLRRQILSLKNKILFIFILSWNKVFITDFLPLLRTGNLDHYVQRLI